MLRSPDDRRGAGGLSPRECSDYPRSPLVRAAYPGGQLVRVRLLGWAGETNRESEGLPGGGTAGDGPALGFFKGTGLARAREPGSILHPAQRDLHHADAVQFLSEVVDARARGVKMGLGRRGGAKKRGQALVLACLVIFVLCLAVLATINLGHNVTERVRLQNTADPPPHSMPARR